MDRTVRKPDGEGAKSSSISPRLVAMVAVGALAAIFILQNRRKSTIHFLSLSASAGTWLALLIAIGIGVALDRLFIWWWNNRRDDKR
jgi:hypothetical protein